MAPQQRLKAKGTIKSSLAVTWKWTMERQLSRRRSRANDEVMPRLPKGGPESSWKHLVQNQNCTMQKTAKRFVGHRKHGELPQERELGKRNCAIQRIGVPFAVSRTELH
jgi:hypothetical protein